MDQIIYLKDYKELALTVSRTRNNKYVSVSHLHLEDNSIVKAIDVLCKENLRVDNITGSIYRKKECICKYTNKKDFIPSALNATGNQITWHTLGHVKPT